MQTATSNAYAVGHGVPIWWQSSDAEVLARASAMLTTAHATAVSTSSPTNTSSSQSGGLSTGAKIGLGVGIPVALLLGLALGFLLWRRRRAQQTFAAVQEGKVVENKDMPHGPPELYNSAEAYHDKHELPLTPGYGAQPPLEVPGHRQAHYNRPELADVAYR